MHFGVSGAILVLVG